MSNRRKYGFKIYLLPRYIKLYESGEDGYHVITHHHSCQGVYIISKPFPLLLDSVTTYFLP